MLYTNQPMKGKKLDTMLTQYTKFYIYAIGNMLLNGPAIRNKPLTGITIAVWVYMDKTDGQQEIFQTIDPKAPVNKHGMYYLEVSDGHVRWFHRNEKGEVTSSYIQW